MKFMKIGTKPDTFYTEEATRIVVSDVPSDFVVRIGNTSYLLHKHPLLPKCGLLQRLCSDSDESESVTVELHDIPGGAEAFELCAKFCYGITISLSAHNFVNAYCAATFLRMIESVEKGNFVPKLEAFLNLCLLEGWKDSIVTLRTTTKLPEWSENLGIIRKCVDSVVEKILTPTTKVSWSYTYTRPGYDKKRRNQLVPRDWWTEDVSELDLDLFRCVIMAVKSTYLLPSQLIGEALHVYACRCLPDVGKARPLSEDSSLENDETMDKNRRILETLVSMIPADKDSVSEGFLLRLLSIANYVRASPVTKAELVSRASMQFEEATPTELLLPVPSSSPQHQYYDTDLVSAVVDSYLLLWRRQSPGPADNSQILRSIRKVGNLIDSYLQVVAKDRNMPISKFVFIAEALPEVARENHDGLYKAINTYLKEHPDITKEDKKRLCRSLDCQKLSSVVRAHAVKNERLPLRKVVQVLFFEQESGSKLASQQEMLLARGKQTPVSEHSSMISKLHLGPEERTERSQSQGKSVVAETSASDRNQKTKKAEDFERKSTTTEIKEVEQEKIHSGVKSNHKKILQRGTRPDLGHHKGRDR